MSRPGLKKGRPGLKKGLPGLKKGRPGLKKGRPGLNKRPAGPKKKAGVAQTPKTTDFQSTFFSEPLRGQSPLMGGDRGPFKNPEDPLGQAFSATRSPRGSFWDEVGVVFGVEFGLRFGRGF